VLLIYYSVGQQIINSPQVVNECYRCKVFINTRRMVLVVTQSIVADTNC